MNSMRQLLAAFFDLFLQNLGISPPSDLLPKSYTWLWPLNFKMIENIWNFIQSIHLLARTASWLGDGSLNKNPLKLFIVSLSTTKI